MLKNWEVLFYYMIIIVTSACFSRTGVYSYKSCCQLMWKSDKRFFFKVNDECSS